MATLEFSASLLLGQRLVLVLHLVRAGRWRPPAGGAGTGSRRAGSWWRARPAANTPARATGIRRRRSSGVAGGFFLVRFFLARLLSAFFLSEGVRSTRTFLDRNVRRDALSARSVPDVAWPPRSLSDEPGRPDGAWTRRSERTTARSTFLPPVVPAAPWQGGRGLGPSRGRAVAPIGTTRPVPLADLGSSARRASAMVTPSARPTTGADAAGRLGGAPRTRSGIGNLEDPRRPVDRGPGGPGFGDAGSSRRRGPARRPGGRAGVGCRTTGNRHPRQRLRGADVTKDCGCRGRRERRLSRGHRLDGRWGHRLSCCSVRRRLRSGARRAGRRHLLDQLRRPAALASDRSAAAMAAAVISARWASSSGVAPVRPVAAV